MPLLAYLDVEPGGRLFAVAVVCAGMVAGCVTSVGSRTSQSRLTPDSMTPPTPRPPSTAVEGNCERRLVHHRVDEDFPGMEPVWIRSYFYNDGGRLVRKEEDRHLRGPRGEPSRVVTGEYDAAGRLIRRDFSDYTIEGKRWIWKYQYNDRGNLAVEQKWAFETGFGETLGLGSIAGDVLPDRSYRLRHHADRKGRLARTEIDFFAYETRRENAVAYTYDSNGNRTSVDTTRGAGKEPDTPFPSFRLEFPDRPPSDEDPVRRRLWTGTTTEYDNQGNPVVIRAREADQDYHRTTDVYWEWRYEYDDGGRPVRVERDGRDIRSRHGSKNGSSGTVREGADGRPDTITIYRYDEQGRLNFRGYASERVLSDQTGRVDVAESYEHATTWAYDDRGRTVRRTEYFREHPEVVEISRVWTFAYGSRGRLARKRKYGGGKPPPDGAGELYTETRYHYRRCGDRRSFPTDIAPSGNRASVEPLLEWFRTLR